MKYAILLDSGPLGKVLHQGEKFRLEVSKLEQFAKTEGISLLIPEIIEREIKEELVARGFAKSLSKLKKMREQKRIIDLRDEDRVLAQAIEEKLAKEGNRVSEEIPSNDGILTAQAINLKISNKYTEVIILTENIRDLDRLANTNVKVWDYNKLIEILQNEIGINLTNLVETVELVRVK